MAVQLGRQDEDQIIIEKPQVHSVKSYFIQASLSKHELLGREKTRSEGQINAIHTQIDTQIRQINHLGGSKKEKWQVKLTSTEEDGYKKARFQSQSQRAIDSKQGLLNLPEDTAEEGCSVFDC